jgi:anti-sigma-K factor RskA
MLNKFARVKEIIGGFNVDGKGNNIMKLGILSEAGQIKKFAVTLEPSGGVPQPTGEMYLIGDS